MPSFCRPIVYPKVPNSQVSSITCTNPCPETSQLSVGVISANSLDFVRSPFDRRWAWGGMVKQGSDGSKKQCRVGKTWWQGRTGWKPGWNLICLWICSGRERRTIMTPIKRSPKVQTRKVIQSFHLPSLKCCSRIEVAIFTVATWLSNWQVHNFDATF